jgi:hypothetical protein
MKSTSIKLIAILIIPFLVVTQNACKKDKSESSPAPSSPNFQSEADNAELDRENSNIFTYVSSTGDTNSEIRDAASPLTACATISVSPLSGWPRTVTIDFGSVNNNACGDGRYRRGKIFATFNNPWIFHMPGDSVTVWTQDYYVNNIKHEGTRYIIIVDSVTIQVVAVNVRATWPDNTYATWNCTRTRTFVSGWSTPYVYLDDVYEHMGSAYGINRLGQSYTLAIRPGFPLVQKMNCNWLVQGILDFTPQNQSVRTLDYGNGNCDNLAVVTVNNISYNIVLP